MKTTLRAIALVLVALAFVVNAQEPAQPPAEKPAAAITLPVAREITDSNGRKMNVVIVSKTADSIHIRRAGDGKEFDLALEKLSPDDRTFVEGLKEPAPEEFDGKTVESNKVFLLRIDGEIYAIQLIVGERKPDVRIDDTRTRSFTPHVKYLGYKQTQLGGFQKIDEETIERKDHRTTKGNNPMQLVESRNGFHFTVQPTVKPGRLRTDPYIDIVKLSFVGPPLRGGPERYPDLPPGAEYYNKQFPSLEAIGSLKPENWIKVTQ